MKSIRRDLEKDFQNCIVKRKLLKFKSRSSIRIIAHEVRLFKPMYILSRGNPLENNYLPDTLGRIDLLFRYKQRNYAGEIKYMPFAVENFWHALKCVAYASYLNWQRSHSGNKRYFPSILMPSKAIKLEHRILAGRLHILLLGINKTDTGWEIEDFTNKVGF